MSLLRFLIQNHTQVLQLTLEHLWLVGISTIFAMLIGIPLGIVIAALLGPTAQYAERRSRYRAV